MRVRERDEAEDVWIISRVNEPNRGIEVITDAGSVCVTGDGFIDIPGSGMIHIEDLRTFFKLVKYNG